VRWGARRGGAGTLPGPHPWPAPGAFAAFGAGNRLEDPVLDVVGPASISIGSAVTVRAYAFLEALAKPGDVVLTLGDRTYVGYSARVTALGGVHLGADVLLSDRVYLSDTGHVYEDVTMPVGRQPLRLGRRLEIGDGAWIGVGAVVVGGLRVGRGAVVAANAVVRADVPDHAVVAGDPATVVRRWDGTAWRRAHEGGAT
jgi:acetyltransferase-like isoleucine patch superfamily enzyme